MTPGDVDLVLAGGLCVTCDEAGTVTAGDVYVDGGRIVAIGGRRGRRGAAWTPRARSSCPAS